MDRVYKDYDFEALFDAFSSWEPSPMANSALMLVGARLRHITTTKWGTKPYLATCNLYEEDVL